MSDSVGNFFQQGTPRSGGLQGPTQTSQFQRSLPNQQQTASLISGGQTESLFLAGASKVSRGIGGLERAKSLKARGELFEFDAAQEVLIGKEQGVIALDALNQAQAANIVAAFSSGITASGSVAQAQQDVQRQASFATQMSKARAKLRAGGLKRRARQVDDQARRTKSAAKTDIIVGSITAAASLFL